MEATAGAPTGSPPLTSPGILFQRANPDDQRARVLLVGVAAMVVALVFAVITYTGPLRPGVSPQGAALTFSVGGAVMLGCAATLVWLALRAPGPPPAITAIGIESAGLNRVPHLTPFAEMNAIAYVRLGRRTRVQLRMAHGDASWRGFNFIFFDPEDQVVPILLDIAKQNKLRVLRK